MGGGHSWQFRRATSSVEVQTTSSGEVQTTSSVQVPTASFVELPTDCTSVDTGCQVGMDVLLTIGEGAEEEWISIPTPLYEELLRVWRVERTRSSSSRTSSSKGA